MVRVRFEAIKEISNERRLTHTERYPLFELRADVFAEK